MKERGLKKRAQVTLFIIFGMLIVIGIVALFLLLPDPTSSVDPSKDPVQVISKCFLEDIEEVIQTVQVNGGYYFPNNYLIYNDTKVSYACYTDRDGELCLQDNTLSKERLEEEIRFNSANHLERCFDELEEELRAFDVTMGTTDYSIEILPNRILARIRKDVVIGSGEESQSYSNFDMFFPSSFFEFMVLSSQILNEEVSCDCGRESCTADTSKIMRNNRDYVVSFFIGSSNEKVYTIEQRTTKERFNFALRNCVSSL